MSRNSWLRSVQRKVFLAIRKREAWCQSILFIILFVSVLFWLFYILWHPPFVFKFENEEQLARSKVLFVCHEYWLGIRSASVSLGYPVALVQDQTLLRHCSDLIKLFEKHKFDTLAISGVPPHSLACARALKAQLPRSQVVLTFHGSFTQHAAQPSEALALQTAVSAAREGILDRVGFLKHGMSFFFQTNNISAVELGNVLEPLELNIGQLHELDGRIHIGLFTSGSSWIKNYLNQLAAACIVSGAVVHTTVIPPEARFLFSTCSATIVEHGWLPSQVVPLFLGMMDINMYASLTECFPMVVLQSLAAGVPCLVSNTSAVYKTSMLLSSKLTVQAHEDVHAIHHVLVNALTELSILHAECVRLLKDSNKHWLHEWEKFLRAKVPRVAVSPLLTQDVERKLVDVGLLQVITICFITEELGRIMPGGMGTLLYGTLRALSTEPRFKLVVVADVKFNEAREWASLLEDDGLDVTVFRVADLVSPAAFRKLDIYTARAARFAEAVKCAYKRMPFDVVEGYDFFGPMARLVQGGYVPSSVRMFVRLHGTLQMIHAAQDIALGGTHLKSRDFLKMSLLEQYAMFKADALIANSVGSAEVYRKLYPNLEEQVIVIVPPPMQQILPARRCSYRPSSSATTYLIYGKQQEVKGTYTVVRAAAQFLEQMAVHNHHAKYRFRFVGHNALGNCSQRHCLWSLIPIHFHNRFDFIESIPKSMLCEVIKDVRAAIFASLSETFCLAAHEIFVLGVPLIISQLDAIRPFFNDTNAITFNPFDVETLVHALQQSKDDDILFDLRSKAIRMQYPSVSSAYTSLLMMVPRPQPLALMKAAETVLNLLEQ